MKISTILDKVDENQLFVPAFQREYVWKRDDAKQLIDSLIKEYPTGTMLTWETGSPPELKGHHKYDEKQGAIRILLDGQQRVTTLYLLIRGKIPPYYTAPEIMNDTRGLYVNVETLELSYYMRVRMQNNPLWQDISDIFLRRKRAKDIVREIEALGGVIERERDDRIDDNMRKIENILDRDFPEQTIPVRATVREAIDIFYIVNAGGVALTDAELALAQISGYWPQARDIFKKKIKKLAEQGFAFKLDFIIYALLACTYHLGSDMKKLHGKENNEVVREVWDSLENHVLDYVVNLLRTHAYVDHTDEINSIYALIPIIAFCNDKKGKHLTDEEIRKMVKWFYYSQIRARYVSQLPQKLDFDLRIIAESSQPFDELLNVIAEERRLKIIPEEFEGRWTSHPLFGLMRWYLKSNDAICLTTGVGLRMNMGEKYRLENDHIFPYSKLKEEGYGMGNRLKYALAQEMTNRAILTQIANRTKSATSASDYLTEASERFSHALALQCIPEDKELWQIDRYEDFLRERRGMLAYALNEYLEGITVTDQVAAPAQVEDLIAEGENDGLELKASLRWDYRRGEVNKKLENVIIRAIAAFSNANGGTLLIGVDDFGDVLGLDNDLASLNADRDKFELHLRNLLNQNLGIAFVTNKLTICFPVAKGLEICQIDISPATEPVIVKFKDDNRQYKEKFFVRSGNSAQELSLSEMRSYVKERFS